MLTLSKIAAIEAQSIRKDLPEFRVGDTVAVNYKIVEGDKLRVQVFRGRYARDGSAFEPDCHGALSAVRDREAAH